MSETPWWSWSCAIDAIEIKVEAKKKRNGESEGDWSRLQNIRKAMMEKQIVVLDTLQSIKIGSADYEPWYRDSQFWDHLPFYMIRDVIRDSTDRIL